TFHANEAKIPKKSIVELYSQPCIVGIAACVVQEVCAHCVAKQINHEHVSMQYQLSGMLAGINRFGHLSHKKVWLIEFMVRAVSKIEVQEKPERELKLTQMAGE